MRASIIVIDDDQTIQETVRLDFERAGCAVTAGEEALAWIQRRRFDVAGVPNLRLSDGAIAVVLSFLEAQSGGRQDEAQQGPAPR